MISIRKEIEATIDEPNNVLKAPHTLNMLTLTLGFYTQRKTASL
jgi:hypothetical protein